MKILKKCLTCGAEFIASKMSNKYCSANVTHLANVKQNVKKVSGKVKKKQLLIKKETQLLHDHF